MTANYEYEYENNFTIPDVNLSIRIPQEVFNSSEALVFTSYKTPALFQVVPPNEMNRSNYDFVADTVVLGFTIPDRNFSELTNPVIITLQSFRASQNMVS